MSVETSGRWLCAGAFISAHSAGAAVAQSKQASACDDDAPRRRRDDAADETDRRWREAGLAPEYLCASICSRV